MNTESPIGFYGHNNLQLAIANTLTAIQADADTVDTSIAGLGKSFGNAPTEILAALYERYH